MAVEYGIFDQRADAARQRHAGAGFGADIGVDVATRQSDMHFAEGHANRLDVLDRHAFHPQPFQEEDLLRGSGEHGDALAFEILDRGHTSILFRNDGHAAIAGRGDHHDSFTCRGAEQGRRNSERAEVDRFGHDGILAFGRRLERQHFDLVACGHELIVEIGCDGMDQLQRAGANDDRLALGAHDRGGCEKPDPEGGHEFTAADSGCHQRYSSVASINATNMPPKRMARTAPGRP